MEQPHVDQLDEVIKEALTKNSITPLVKMELASKVRQRRSLDGKGDLVVKFEPPKVYQLTDEERVKIERRKHRNRQSAWKARVKQKQHEKNLEDDLQKLENERESLNSELQQLNAEKERYKRILYTHLLAVKTRLVPCRMAERLTQRRTFTNT